MDNTKVTNPDDFKVVEFFNSTDFNFTPDLGAMYDGRPLFVGSGERRQFPYHVGHRLATNLAKAVLIKAAPLHDPSANNPVGTPLWSEDRMKNLANSFLTELYVEDKPIVQTETDRLMARVAELEKNFQQKEAQKPEGTPKESVKSLEELVTKDAAGPATAPEAGYQDKAEVIAELEKRGIAHDKRQGKSALEKLLA